MLISIRERATGWIAWAIVILITIPFALWGVNSYFSGGTNVNVAEFDGEEIDYQTYQRALYNERERVRQQYGQNVSADFLSGNILGRQVVNRLANEILLYRNAQDQGFRISDEQLAAAILSSPGFQTEDGKFSRDRYERVLQLSGYSPSQFEEIQRNSAAVQQIQTGFIESVLPMDDAVDNILNVLKQKRIGEYSVIEPSRFLSESELSEEEIRASYDRDKDQYKEEGRVKVQYIELLLSDFAKNLTPDEETLRDLYNAETGRYLQTEQRRVSHILLQTEGDEDAGSNELASQLIERLRAGEDFGALAIEYSTDVGSAESEGSIGWIGRGTTLPEFEAVAFSLKAGEISEPFRTNFGIHIIQVNEIETEKVKDFEEVRDELVEQVNRERAELEMFETSEELRSIAYEQPDSLDSVADTLGLNLEVSEWFTRTEGTGIAEIPAVRATAFSDEVLQQEFNSDVIQIDDGHLVVLRKNKFQAAEQLELAEVKAEITEKLLTLKSVAKAQGFAEELIKELKDGGDWNQILSENGISVTEIPSSDNESTGPLSFEIAKFVYSAEKPSLEKVVYGGSPVGDGQYMIFRLTGVVSGDTASASEDERRGIENAVRQRFSLGLFETYVTQLRDGIEIDINDELL